MRGLLRQLAVVAGLVGLAAAGWTLAGRARPAVAEAGFWFDDVGFRSVRLGGAIGGEDLRAIEQVARGELQRAFDGLPIRVTDRRDARYRIRVAPEVTDRRMRGSWGVAGHRRAELRVRIGGPQRAVLRRDALGAGPALARRTAPWAGGSVTPSPIRSGGRAIMLL